MAQGFLLLNATPVLSSRPVKQEARQWQPFMAELLRQLSLHKPDVELILWGKIAAQIQALPAADQFKQIIAEHPYNISFITNPVMLDFFRPLDLLTDKEHQHVQA